MHLPAPCEGQAVLGRKQFVKREVSELIRVLQSSWVAYRCTYCSYYLNTYCERQQISSSSNRVTVFSTLVGSEPADLQTPNREPGESRSQHVWGKSSTVRHGRRRVSHTETVGTGSFQRYHMGESTRQAWTIKIEWTAAAARGHWPISRQSPSVSRKTHVHPQI